MKKAMKTYKTNYPQEVYTSYYDASEGVSSVNCEMQNAICINRGPEPIPGWN